MPALRGFASLVAGFLLLPLVMRGGLLVVLAVAPDLVGSPGAGPTESFMALNLALAFLAAALSGALTARLAPEPAFLWVLLLAFLVFVGGLVFGIQQTGAGMPTWYLLSLPLTTGLAIMLGGWGLLRVRIGR